MPVAQRRRVFGPVHSRARHLLVVATSLVPAACAGEWSRIPGSTRSIDLAAPPLRSAFHEADQAIADLLVHFDPARSDEVLPTFRDLARSLAPTTRLTVAIAAPAHQAAAMRLLATAGFPPERCRFVACDGPISMWARDRLIPFVHAAGVHEFFQPTRERVDAGVTGDIELAHRLSKQHGGRVLSGCYLEGGNVVVGSGRVFVGYAVVDENPPFRTHVPLLVDALRQLFDAEPVLVGGPDGVPNPHVDMFLTHVGDDRVLLGDPGLGLAAWRRSRAAGDPDLPAGVTAATQQAWLPVYDRIRDQLQAAGLQVERLPILHTEGQAIYTWNNALVERQGDGRRAYVPVYGIAALDDLALATYRRLGFQTFPIDVRGVMHRGGTVRCLTNVLRWSGASRVVQKPVPGRGAAPPPAGSDPSRGRRPAELHGLRGASRPD